MNCHDITQELAVPTGAVSGAEMSAHLASCPSCRQSEREEAAFQNLWSATRLPDPPASGRDAAWSSLWAQVLEHAAVAETETAVATVNAEESLHRQRHRRAWYLGLSLGAGAGMLAAAGLLLAAMLGGKLPAGLLPSGSGVVGSGSVSVASGDTNTNTKAALGERPDAVIPPPRELAMGLGLTPISARDQVVLEQGQLLVWHVDGDVIQTDWETTAPRKDGKPTGDDDAANSLLAADFVILNYMEGLAQ